VQGPDRLRLERHRTRARVTLLQRRREADQQRYSEIEAAQPDVLRRRRPVGPRVEAADEGNPFEERTPPAVQPEAMPAPAEPRAGGAAADEPFGGPAPSTSKAEQVEDLAAEREDGAAQRDQQAEQEAAGGDR
jgi:hypothetical protein